MEEGIIQEEKIKRKRQGGRKKRKQEEEERIWEPGVNKGETVGKGKKEKEKIVEKKAMKKRQIGRE